MKKDSSISVCAQRACQKYVAVVARTKLLRKATRRLNNFFAMKYVTITPPTPVKADGSRIVMDVTFPAIREKMPDNQKNIGGLRVYGC